MSYTEGDLNARVKFAVREALDVEIPKAREKVNREFAEALGVKGNALSAAIDLKTKSKEAEERLSLEARETFDKETQKIIDQAKKDGKLKPAEVSLRVIIRLCS